MSQFLSGLSDPPEVTQILGEAQGAVAFDVGANAGHVTCLLARRFEHVYAWEPCDESYVELCRRLPSNAVAIRAAVTASRGVVDLDVVANAITTGQLVTGRTLETMWGPPTGTRTVDGVTLDGEAERLGVYPDLVKIDTEGHEVAVVDGGARTLREAKVVVIEVHGAEHGAQIVQRVARPWRQIDNPTYQPGSFGQTNHFYLVSP